MCATMRTRLALSGENKNIANIQNRYGLNLICSRYTFVLISDKLYLAFYFTIVKYERYAVDV